MARFDFEPTGRLKLPSQEELLQADADTAILAYSHGTLDDGNPYWAYIAVKPSKYREFYRLSAAKQMLVMSEYGAVLAAGYGHAPPPDVIREMKERYGCDPDYENKLVADIHRQQDAFVEQREQRLLDIVTMLKKKQGE